MQLVISKMPPTAPLVRTTQVMTQHCPLFALQTLKYSRCEGNCRYLESLLVRVTEQFTNPEVLLETQEMHEAFV
jgi:hypothetical protein